MRSKESDYTDKTTYEAIANQQSICNWLKGL